MAFVPKAFLLAVFAIMIAGTAQAGDTVVLTEHAVGKASAPVKVDEYMSITCSHCADFYISTLPELEKRYVNTGKVRFVLHDFPLNGISLKAAAVAHCMPPAQYFPFIKTLYTALKEGYFGGSDSEGKLFQYAALGGLPMDKAKACANDTKLQDALIEQRTAASNKYDIKATPTFVINDGAEIISGAQSLEAFSAVLDRQLAAHK
jgi:protein-disulfide isomerase